MQQGAYRPTSASSAAAGSGVVTLDNFNEHAAACLINSPRSLAAMKRLGISGAELLYRPPSHRSFVEGVDSQTAELLPDYVNRRYNHYEHKRQAKVRALREEREADIAQGSSAGGQQMVLHSSAHHGADSALIAQARERASTALEMEKEEIARMQQRLLTKLNNTLAFEIRRAQTLDKAQSKVDYAHARAEAEKQYRAAQQAEREEAQKQAVAEQQRRLREEAEQRRQQAAEDWQAAQQHSAQKLQADRDRRAKERQAQVDHRNRTEEKRLQLEAIQEMQRRVIAEKEAHLQQKENERLRAEEERRREMAEYNAAQQAYLKDKLDGAAARAAQIAEEKRARFEEKEAAAEAKRREFEAERAWEREQARLRGLEKDHQLRAAQEQSQAIQRAKAEAVLRKEQEHAERLAERDRIRAMDEGERRAWLADREAQRKFILNQSYALREERGNQILAKRAALNSRSNRAMQQRDAEIRERKLAEQLLAEDRKEQVARMARIQAHQREELLHRIQTDRERIESLQHQSHQLAQQRLKLRDMAERQQTELLQKFERLRAHPEKLRALDPNNIDVVRMGFLSQEDAAQLLSFKSVANTLTLTNAAHTTRAH